MLITFKCACVQMKNGVPNKAIVFEWVVSRLARIRSCQNDGLLHCSVENAVVSCENHRERLRQHELDFHL